MTRSSRARTSAESPAASASSVSRASCSRASAVQQRCCRLPDDAAWSAPPRWRRSPETRMSPSASGAGIHPRRAAARATHDPAASGPSAAVPPTRESEETVVPTGLPYRSPRPPPQASRVHAPAGIATRRPRASRESHANRRTARTRALYRSSGRTSRRRPPAARRGCMRARARL